MSVESQRSVARQISLSSMRHRLTEIRQLLKGAPLEVPEKEFLSQLIDCLDIALDECRVQGCDA